MRVTTYTYNLTCDGCGKALSVEDLVGLPKDWKTMGLFVPGQKDHTFDVCSEACAVELASKTAMVLFREPVPA